MILLMNIRWNWMQENSLCVFFSKALINAEIYLYSSLGKSCPEAIMSSTWAKIFVIKPKWLIWCSSDTGLFYGFVNTLGAKFKCVLGDINLATKLFMSYCCSVCLSAVGSQLHLVWCYLCCFEQSCALYFPITIQYLSVLATLCCWWYSYQRSIIEVLCLISWTTWCKQKLQHSIVGFQCYFENTPMGVNMKYIEMHSKTMVKVGSEEDGRGQLLYSLLRVRVRVRKFYL